MHFTSPNHRAGVLVVVVTVLIGWAATAAHAGPVFFRFSGKIQSSSSPLVAIGDTFIGEMRYDTDTPREFLVNNTARYEITPPDGVYFTVGSVTQEPGSPPAGQPNLSAMIVTNNRVGGLAGVDAFSVTNNRLTGQVLLGSTRDDVLDSNDPPAELTLSPFDFRRSFFGTDDELRVFQGEILNLTPADEPIIPLPPAVWSGLLCAGLLALRQLQQRRRVNAAA